MAPDFAHDIQDQAASLHDTLGAYLDFIADAIKFYSARAQAERDHANNLRGLLSKTLSRRNKLAAALVVGCNPAKSYQDGQAHHTLESAWSRILGAQDESAQSYISLATQIDGLCQELTKIHNLGSAALKKHNTFYTNKLLALRESTESERVKCKAKYDDACQALEQARQKKDAGKDEERAERHYRKAESAMKVAKNAYLVSIHVANESKKQFYSRDLPRLHSKYQLIWTILVHALARTLERSTVVQQQAIDQWNGINAKVLQAIQSMDVQQDQAIYIEYNARPFFEPPSSAFEPCSLWHDDEQPITEGDAKLFLQNLLAARQRDLSAPSLLDAKGQEYENLLAVAQSYDKNPANGSAQEALLKLLDASEEATSLQLIQDEQEAEADVAASALGDDVGDQRPHALKASSFAKPAACHVCGQNIWGLGKPGLVCKCGLMVHTKCEAMAPANCPRSAAVSATPRRRSGSNATAASSVRRQSARNSFVPGSPTGSIPPTLTEAALNPSAQRRKVLYDFEPSTELELAVSAGDVVDVQQADKQGWTQVRGQNGAVGLVPTNYLQNEDAPAASSSDDSLAEVRADFDASGDGEVSVQVGEKVFKVRLEEGGWATVRKQDGTSGIVPAWAVD